MPLQSDEDSPYGIPPYLSALNSILIQIDSMDNVKNIIKKFGLLGFLSATKKIPIQDAGKTETEHRNSLEEKLKKFAKNFSQNFKSGIAVSYDDVSYDYKSFGSDSARGAKDILQEVEQQIASGLDIDPALLGRTYSTTETYAGVVYASFLASLGNIRRIVKRFLERGYYLHLVMAGYPVSSVKVTFNKDRGMNPKEELEAEEVKVRTVLTKYQAGIIDADVAARELGYDKATGIVSSKENKLVSENLLKKKAFILDKTGSVEFKENKKKEAREQKHLELIAQREFLNKHRKEVIKISNVIKKMHQDNRSEAEILSFVSKSLKTNIPQSLLPIIREYTKRIWKAGATIDTDKGSIVATVATDKDAINWFVNQQDYDFGKVFKGFEKPLKKAVTDSIRGIGKTQKEVLALLAKAPMGTMLSSDAVRHYKLIVSNAANKSRNFARTLTYEEIGVQEIEIVALIDRKTSPICRTMNGRRIRTQTATTFVREVMATDSRHVVKKYPWPKPIEVQGGVSTNKILAGIKVKLPPYHGNCRTTIVVGLPETIINRTGKTLSRPTWPGNKVMEKLPKGHPKYSRQKLMRDHLAQTRSYYRGLTNDEVASKVNSARGSKWIDTLHKQPKMRYDLDYHVEKHKNKFREYGKNVVVKTKQDYINISHKVLNDFDRVFPHANKNRNRVAFYNSKINVVSVVDMDEHRIVTCFPFQGDINKKYKYRMELK